MNNNIALIAGEGILPVEIAKKLNALQDKTLILTLRDDPEKLEPYSSRLIRMRTPNLGRVVREIKRFGSEKLIMAGRIPKKIIYCLPLIFDRLSRSVLKKTLRDDHSLLASIVKVFESENIQVIPYWQILPEFIASAGKLTNREPTQSEFADINYGVSILQITLPCSFGQAVCVAGGAVVSIEAMEGTDLMIKRSGSLSGRGVVVKMIKPGQDLRYDLPTVGTRTLENMHEAGLTCLAVEAGRTLILEPEKFFNLAEKYNIAVWGL